MLDQVAEGDITAKANEQGEKLKTLWNSVFAAEAIPWAAYGLGSSVYIFTNPDNLEIDPANRDSKTLPCPRPDILSLGVNTFLKGLREDRCPNEIVDC